MRTERAVSLDSLNFIKSREVSMECIQTNQFFVQQIPFGPNNLLFDSKKTIIYLYFVVMVIIYF